MTQAELSAEIPARAIPADVPVGRAPSSRRLTARKAVRSGVVWGYVFGALIASSAVSYTRIYQTQAARDALAAAYGANKATSALFGPAPQLQTVAGFTAFKISMTLMLLGAVWGLLTSTRLLRGEEDGGRWELLLAGQTTRRRAAAQALAGLGAGAGVLWALTAILTVVVGLDSSVKIAAGPALYFALAMAATAVMFLAVGALASQLAPTRRQAASYAACVSRRELRRPDDRRRRGGTARADLGVAAGLGGGAAAVHRAPAAGPAADRRLHRGAGRRRRPAGRRPRRRRGHPQPTGRAARRGCGCYPGRPAWRSGWSGRRRAAGGPRSRCRRCCSG